MCAKKLGKLVLGGVMVLLLATACGDDEEPTTAPEATQEAAAETETEAPETTEAAEEEPEESQDPAAEKTEAPEDEDSTGGTVEMTFDPLSFVKLFDSCIGVEGTAGESLKVAELAMRFLGYSEECQMSELTSDSKKSLKEAMQTAYDQMTKANQKELKHIMSESIMPFISDSLEDPEVYADVLEDAGISDKWSGLMRDKHKREDWGAFRGTFMEVTGL